MNLNFNGSIFNKFPVMESDRLVFRQFLKKDAKQFFKIRSHPEVMKFMDAIVLKSEDEALTLIKALLMEFKIKRGITWAIVDKKENKLIGTFGFWRIVKNHCYAEIGFSLLPEYWGKGIMLEAFKTLMEYGFNVMNLHRFEANVNPSNSNSIKILEKVGFRKEAHFRENFFFNNTYIDSAIYCLLETDIRNY
jgi:[ribosomal protein S5]-alanine N-acetyltransferase